MNDVIRLLPDSVANQIAAGEVIQQPSSVIKELMENSIDAGATHVTIILKDAGRTLIQVVDDGCGMSETDARLAFERHATSKIKKADDLFALHTMGFRGEALASIAAVAQVDLRTRRATDTIGTRIEISGSKVVSQEPAGCAVGSNMSIKNLFFNVPARRKFLKKDSVEFSNVVKEFERMALVNPDVELTLIHNDVTVHRLSPAPVKQRIVDLFGKSLANQLIPVATDTSLVKISGYICQPEYARRKGALQFLTVNGRNMRHPVFHKAVMQCYESLIAHDAKPNFFIDFQVDPDTIDVNIHPTKNEIKFENEMAIRQILVAAVRESMGRYNVVPAIDFDAVDVPEIPAFEPDINARHDVEIDPGYNPFGNNNTRIQQSQPMAHGSDMNRPGGLASGNWEALYENFTRNTGSSGVYASSAINANPDQEDRQSLIDMEPADNSVPGALQLKNRYIITPSREGLMAVDQHRAHVNVLYHRYLDSINLKDMPAQTLLFPESVELSPSQSTVLDSIIADLHEVGFDLTFLGDNVWCVNAIPAVLGSVNAQEAVRHLVEEVAEVENPGNGALTHTIAMSMAKASAVRAGQPMSQKEVEYLLSELFKLPSPALTPDGHRVFSVIPVSQIADMLR